MKIYSMTATFGKLNHQTITLETGMNVIHAPNEWGKSTWCAFLSAMLYGIDTRERSTQTALAEKERYAPWSGDPMSGRIDLNWNGKDITIERRTKGRSVFGEFRAYETESGLPIPELTAANCGEVLLGVEKNVFTRSAFIKLSNLPVTQDDALRRRLNALVTTGDENDAGDALAQKLKDLKNRCRHNKTGLLPQAETQKAQLNEKLQQLQQLRSQCFRYSQQQEQLQQQIEALENHEAALRYAASREDAKRVEDAQAVAKDKATACQSAQTQCSALPSAQEAADKLEQLQALQLNVTSMQSQSMPVPPVQPEQKRPFQGLDAVQTEAMLQQDLQKLHRLTGKKQLLPFALLAGGICLAAVALSFVLSHWFWLLLPVGLIPLLLKYSKYHADQRTQDALAEKYASGDPSLWKETARQHIANLQAYQKALADYEAAGKAQSSSQNALQQKVLELTQGLPLDAAQNYWKQVQKSWQSLALIEKEAEQAQKHADALASMVKPVAPPEKPDRLTCSALETQNMLSDARFQYQQLHMRLGQCQGQMETLGQEEVLQQQLAAVQDRIDRLEETYSAVTLAMDTLEQATLELQRRFAPRIAQQAQQFMQKLTDSRYDRLQLTQDLSLHTCADGEDTLRSAMWRSDGTIDQLYLALRLAVAQELIPQAPLVLDDALVRFDDHRAKKALEILKELSGSRQVILFTCQRRESQLLE